jgi:hypothetical protein
MTHVAINHFSNINEPIISYDGSRYSVFGEPSPLICDNFKDFSEDEKTRTHHINYFTFRKFFELLAEFDKPQIIETGSSAYGTNSSVMLDNYVCKYGGELHTVDINPQTTRNVRARLSTHSYTYTGDSVDFLRAFNGTIDAAYLDSYDLDFNNPRPAAEHGRNEMEALLPLIKTRALILIDDTPKSAYYLPFRNNVHTKLCGAEIMPGKGMYAEDVLKAHTEFQYTKILHMYAVLYDVRRI